MRTEELRFRWLIDGEDKYLIREDGSRIGPTDATDCEIELWKARQAAYSQGYKDALKAAGDAAFALKDRWDCLDCNTGGEICKVISTLPIPEAQK